MCGQGKGTAAMLCWAPGTRLLPWPGSIPRLPNHPPCEGWNRRLRSGSQHCRTGKDPGKLCHGCHTPCSRSQWEESPFTRHKPLQLPWEAPPTALGEARAAAQQAKHCKESSCKEKIPYRADRKASSTSQSQGNSTLILLDPHFVLKHPGNRAGTHTKVKEQEDQKVHPAPEFPMKGASAAGRKERKSWNL